MLNREIILKTEYVEEAREKAEAIPLNKTRAALWDIKVKETELEIEQIKLQILKLLLFHRIKMSNREIADSMGISTNLVNKWMVSLRMKPHVKPEFKPRTERGLERWKKRMGKRG